MLRESIKPPVRSRPPSERMLTKKLDLRGINVMRDWRVCLDEYLAEYYAGYLA